MRIRLSPRLIARLMVLAAASWYFLSAGFSPREPHLVDAIDLVFHEAGHTLFFWAPQLVEIMMGSGVQIAVPLSLAWYFFRKREYFAVALMLLWTGYNVVNVSVYAADAMGRTLPLLGDDGVIHDWSYIAAETGLGPRILGVAKALYLIGLGIVLYAIVLGFAHLKERKEA